MTLDLVLVIVKDTELKGSQRDPYFSYLTNFPVETFETPGFVSDSSSYFCSTIPLGSVTVQECVGGPPRRDDRDSSLYLGQPPGEGPETHVPGHPRPNPDPTLPRRDIRLIPCQCMVK